MKRQKPQSIQLKQGDLLLIIDLQNDFLTGGALAVPRSDEIIPVLNQYIRLFQKPGLPIFMTRDWHPPDHQSFKSQGGPWPKHCIAGSTGAAFSESLLYPTDAQFFSTGIEVDNPGYSGFENAEFNDQLVQRRIERLFIGGLATDYCVLNTVLDALKFNYSVFLLIDAVRAVNVHPDDGIQSEQNMISHGAVPIVLEMIK